MKAKEALVANTSHPVIHHIRWDKVKYTTILVKREREREKVQWSEPKNNQLDNFWHKYDNNSSHRHNGLFNSDITLILIQKPRKACYLNRVKYNFWHIICSKRLHIMQPNNTYTKMETRLYHHCLIQTNSPPHKRTSGNQWLK